MSKKKPIRRTTSSAEAATAEDFLQQAEPSMAVLNKKAATDKEKAQHLRAYHRLGSLSRALVPDHAEYGEGVLEKHAAAVGRPYRLLSYARRFAAEYDNAELSDFCKHPLGVSHIRALTGFDNKRQRTKLQKQAYDQKLSVKGLGELKKQKIEPKRSGGAPIKVADNPKTAVLELLSDGDTWTRRCEATVKKLSYLDEQRVPADLQDVAEQGIERLKAIARAARQAEKELRRLSGDA